MGGRIHAGGSTVYILFFVANAATSVFRGYNKVQRARVLGSRHAQQLRGVAKGGKESEE